MKYIHHETYIFKALEKEVGDNVDIKAILNGQSNWRGRQQQIRMLQNKVIKSFLLNYIYLVILKIFQNLSLMN